MEESESMSNEKFLPMLDFERQMLLDVIDSDCLLITAKGLNPNIIIVNILRAHLDASNLVLVLNSADNEEKYFENKLKIDRLPTTGAEREKAYLNGGVRFVSTRILVVDLLKNRVPVEHITGIIVLRAHTVLESCQEAFALRLYRQKNKTGFIKAFSHSPLSFTFGFAHVEKIMRSLFVTELFLWPRFHGLVTQCLKKYQPTVVELHVPLSQKSTLIQTCILDIMNYTTKEIKKINKTLDLQEITVENCITRKFHKILQSQLDCVWHQLSVRTKELIQDLKILRKLIIQLIHNDAVKFYALLNQYRTSEYAKVNSGWLFLDSTEQLFKHAKTRVFNTKQEFEPETNQKWIYLNEILTVEIPNDQKKQGNVTQKNVKILILCHDNRTCSQLNEFLTMGPCRLLLLSAIRNHVKISSACEKYKTVQFKDCNILESLQNAEKSTKENITLSELSEKLEINLEEESDKNNFVLTMSQCVTGDITDDLESEKSTDNSLFEPFTQLENMDLSVVENEVPIVYIQPFKNQTHGICLEDTLHALKPRYIIMYHSDITSTRQIETYEARTKQPLTVFFLLHAKTTEEQSYLTSLRKEKEAFELLIETKRDMVVPSYQDGKSEIPSLDTPGEIEVNTRKAGGQDKNESSAEKSSVIVDMREFRSDLPALLHKKGINIDPVTISIGDYILTPDICVERKSLSDLIGSLNSGRLYTQCLQMCRHYARPILLIEFDQNRPFQLQGHYMVSSDTPDTEIRQKLQLLTLHFPKLKLVWSPSPYATADLFYELKNGREQPSREIAVALGEDILGDGYIADRYNPSIYDFILKLPGVNSKNIARIMNKGISIDNIVTLPKDELYEIVGNKIDGDMLWNILHYTHESTNQSRSEINQPKNRFGKPMRGRRKKQT